MSDPWLVIAAVLLASFVQGAVGFGFGMISMAILPIAFDVPRLVPLVSLLGVAMSLHVLWRWRRAFDAAAVRPLVIGVCLGAPLGATALASVDRRIALGTLAVVLIGVAGPALYKEWRGLTRADPRSRLLARHALLAGIVSGLFGGAFNTGGPPLILYGSASAWPPPAFRANLQVVFLFTSALQLTVLTRAGFIDAQTLRSTAIALPALFLGAGLGTLCTRSLASRRFRLLVWALLLVLAGNCLLGALRT